MSLAVLQLCATLGLGGSERLALESAAAWQQAGGRSIIAGAPGGLVAEIKARHIEYCPLPTAGYNLWHVLGNACRLVRLIRDKKIGIVHFHNRAPGWSALLAARWTKIPLISTYHSAYGMGSAFKRGFNSVMARADRVIVTSHYIGRYMDEHHGADGQNRRILIRNGIDLQRFDRANVSSERVEALRAALGLKNGCPVFIVPARLTRLKGHHVIVEAAAQLAAKGSRNFLCLFVGGDEKKGSYRAGLERRIGELSLQGYVRFAGPVQDMPAAYAAADFSILASTMSENIGLARMEASAMGLPQITTNIGGAAEVVLAPPAVTGPERTGWLVPRHDAKALAEAMQEALDLSSEERAALAGRARRKISREFNADAGLQQIVELYRRLAGHA